MLRYLILIFILPMFVFGQAAFPPSKDEQTKVYCQAIAEYIKAVSKKDTFNFDTLFIGKHEEFPDIQLPAIIQNTKITSLTVDESKKRYKCSKPYLLINLVEQSFTQKRVEFICITFLNLHPQHNAFINFNYNIKKKEFELDEEIKFKNPYSKNNQ